ncbi:HpcH/HpaI aldolase/citrate lyase family protein [Agrobacterium sp. NPDC090273]|uniref:HpcH/HpaI aldolase family protein n=1 Tax=Agrobacterium sp. NPDC090273 TaxID=3363919 RepID=UPI00383BDC18
MASEFEPLSQFRKKCLGGAIVTGTFQKTPSRQVAEVLSRSGLDFVVLDSEHAPFSIDVIDDILASTRSRGFPILVRVGEPKASFIGACLDAGAAGIVVPHVTSADVAREAVSSLRFVGGGRGLSASGRAGDYGAMTLGTYMEQSDQAVSLWCQIEDVEAVDAIDEICSVNGVDALFVGRADLMRSLGAVSVTDPSVVDAVQRIAEAGVKAGRRLAIFIVDVSEAAELRKIGFSIFVCGSDQSMLKSVAHSTATAVGAIR